MLKKVKFIFLSYRLQFIRKKTFVMFVLVFTLLEMYIFPVIQYSLDMDYPSSVWLFPFIISDLFFLFLFLCCILYFNMDIPFFHEVQSYRIIRMGRMKWIGCQIVALFLRCFSVMVITAGLSVAMILPWARWETDWGKLIYTMAFSGTELPYSILYIRYETLEKFGPIQLMLLAILIGTLVLMFLSMLTMFFSLYVNKILGTVLAGTLVAFMFVYQNQSAFMHGILRYFSPGTWMRVIWLDAEKYGNPVLPSLRFILLLLIGSIVIMGVLIGWRIRRVEIFWEKEDF